MSASSKKWYVLRAAGGKEKKAKEYLEKEIERCGLQDLVSQVLVPTEKVYRIRDGKRICTERLFYPGYVLIEAELTGELQHIIRNEVPHMSGFLTEKRDVKRGEGKPQEEKLPIPLRDDEVRRILGEQDEQAVAEAETVVDYSVGEAVKITDLIICQRLILNYRRSQPHIGQDREKGCKYRYNINDAKFRWS
jgi:transcriptional antiterminator NusG